MTASVMANREVTASSLISISISISHEHRWCREARVIKYPYEGANQRCKQLRPSVRPSEVIRGNLMSSDVIRGHQRASEAIRGRPSSHRSLTPSHTAADEVLYARWQLPEASSHEITTCSGLSA
jgi:hypothetical protein